MKKSLKKKIISFIYGLFAGPGILVGSAIILGNIIGGMGIYPATLVLLIITLCVLIFKRDKVFFCGAIVSSVLSVALLSAMLHDPNQDVYSGISSVQSDLRALSTAAETYSTANNGTYPPSVEALLNVVPPYMDDNLCAQVTKNYRFECSFSSDQYLFKAFPVNDDPPYTTITMTTGGVLEGRAWKWQR